MNQSIKKSLTVFCLCTIQIYLASQLIGQTEASYSSQKSTELSISTAFVFPKTITLLEAKAENSSTTAETIYRSIIPIKLEDSVDSLTKQLEIINEGERQVNLELQNVLNVYAELKKYNDQIFEQSKAEQHLFNYVQKGFHNVAHIVRELNGKIQFDRIEELKVSIQARIQEIKESKKPIEENEDPNLKELNSDLKK